MTGRQPMRTWFPWNPQPPSRDRVQLLCFPYAGGSAAVFRQWRRLTPAALELYPVELPGRGARLREVLASNLREMAESCARAWHDGCGADEVVLFGHSMGGWLAFGTAVELERLGTRVRHLFVSAIGAPLSTPRPQLSHGDAEVLDKLQSFGGTPPLLLQDPVLLQHALPTLRADFAAVRGYVSPEGERVRCDLTVFEGTDDRTVATTRLEAWRGRSVGRFTRVPIEGDHFFVHSAASRLAREVAERSSTGPTRGLRMQPRAYFT